jgi:hypothetical protein
MTALLLLSMAGGCAAAEDPRVAGGGGGTGGATPTTPRTAVPAELAGGWSDGTSSLVDYYNPASGEWNTGASTGESYTFNPDGTFQWGFLAQSSLYGCSIKAFVFRAGTMTVEDSTITLYPTLARSKSEYSCTPSSNTDREGPRDPHRLEWKLIDDAGTKKLSLTDKTVKDGKPTLYRRP